jgi:hypothetical protein
MVKDAHLGEHCGLIPIEMLVGDLPAFELYDGG